MKYRFIEDPGHGWLEVERAEIERLGIAGSISPFSYVKGGLAYLEEDCDLTVFMKAKEKAREPVKMDRVYQENTPIRHYESWSA